MLKKKHLFYLVDYRLKLLFVSWGALYFTMFTMFIVLLKFFKNDYKSLSFYSKLNFDYLRIEIFEDINLGLYSVIKEYGIKELFENYTVEEVYELIKEKLDCIKNGNLE